MATNYDEWLATTPEDEEVAANIRARQKEAKEKAAREYGAHKDSTGRVHYEEDYLYDPLSRGGFE